MTEENPKNIIRFSDARKRKKINKNPHNRPYLNGKGSRPQQKSLRDKETWAPILRWVQFILLLALTTYVMQRCGIL